MPDTLLHNAAQWDEILILLNLRPVRGYMTNPKSQSQACAPDYYSTLWVMSKECFKAGKNKYLQGQELSWLWNVFYLKKNFLFVDVHRWEDQNSTGGCHLILSLPVSDGFSSYLGRVCVWKYGPGVSWGRDCVWRVFFSGAARCCTGEAIRSLLEGFSLNSECSCVEN